jgi:hypothetical protein
MSDATYLETQQKLDQLRAAAREKFSEDEINKIITMGKQLCGKAVITAAARVVEEGAARGFNKAIGERIARALKAVIPYNYSGFVSCGFKEIDYTLNITLSIVERDYKTDIDIPSADYARDLFQKYDFLKSTAIAYWRQFAEEHPELYKKLCAYRSDVDFGNLTVDPNNPTTMYFDPESEYRIGIFCYYVDKAGRPLYKRGAKNNVEY